MFRKQVSIEVRNSLPGLNFSVFKTFHVRRGFKSCIFAFLSSIFTVYYSGCRSFNLSSMKPFDELHLSN